SYTSSRWIVTSLGASIPRRTVSPWIDTTIRVIESPMMIFSSCLRLKTSMAVSSFGVVHDDVSWGPLASMTHDGHQQLLPFRLIRFRLNGPIVSMFGKEQTGWADSPANMAVSARNRGDRSDRFNCDVWARHQRVAAAQMVRHIRRTPCLCRPPHAMSSPLTENPPTDRWYRDGLRFECTQCGNCCTGMPGHVWVDEADIARIAEYLDKPIGEIRLL